jgi:ribosomal protein S18 acetylase RimI-like enzyme
VREVLHLRRHGGSSQIRGGEGPIRIERDGGYCELSPTGEFLAVEVDPARRGEGLGRRLVEAGLAQLAERGIREASVSIDGENTAGLRLFRHYGFRQHSIDIEYRWRSETSDPS